MRRRLFIAMGVILGAVLILPAASAAQTPQKETKAAAAKQDRIDGTVHMIDKAAHTITVRVRGKTQQREVIFDDKTAITFRNKPSKWEELKEGRRVIVVGKTNDKAQLMATRIDIRDSDPK